MYAAVVDDTHTVTNIVALEDDAVFDPGPGLTVVPLADHQVVLVQVGDRLVDGEVVTPDPPAEPEPDPGQGDPDPVETPPSLAEIAADVADLRDRFAALCAELGVDYAEGL